MIHSPPEIVHLAVDLHVDLIEVPLPVAKAAHTADPLPTNIRGEHRAEPVPPLPDGLVTDVDPAFEQQILYVPQA